MKLHYAGRAGDGFGWGVCNKHLLAELGKRCEMVGPDDADAVFMPLADHDFNPATPARAKVNIAYTFFEYPISEQAVANCAKYDVVFCGSSWCRDRLRERGVTNTDLLIQGVDTAVFKRNPQPRPDNEFRIFSGGKFEWRKGQDLVLAAFKLLMGTYPDMLLAVSWHNFWPQLYQTMNQSTFIKCPAHWTADWESNLKLLLQLNGIPKERVFIAPPMPQQFMEHIYNQTDCGVFPNRCEGGTNLVLMEYAACGLPVVANSGTGHADVSRLIHTTIEGEVSDSDHWCYSKPEHVASAIERCYASKDEQRPPDPWPFTWGAAAEKIVARCG